MRASAFICLVFVATVCVAGGCSSAPAKEPEQVQVQPDPGDLWRCFAHQAYYAEDEVGQWPGTKTITGKLLFHSVTPDAQWASMAQVSFMSLTTDPEMTHGNGISAIVAKDDPQTVHLFMVVDGRERALGSYPYGTPVPFEVTFDDAAGTVTVESGAFAMTAKPSQMLRGHFKLTCSGADVSFTDFDSKN